MANVLTAPIPGVVLEIKVTEGQIVAENETILVLESMKMENDITTYYGGTVSKILVKKGDTVNSEDALVEIE